MGKYYWDPATGSVSDWTFAAGTNNWRFEIVGGVLEIQPNSNAIWGVWLLDAVNESTNHVEAYMDAGLSASAGGRGFQGYVTTDMELDSARFFGGITNQLRISVSRGAVASFGASITEFAPDTDSATRKRYRALTNGEAAKIKAWLPQDEEPVLWGADGSSENNVVSGKQGIGGRLNTNQILYVHGFGVGTDGDPAPTGPVDVSAEPFLLRHNPRTNKVIPVLSSPTVTDIGANCVRPRVTKGF